MAVTAHWIHAYPSAAPNILPALQLRSRLVGFHHVPGRHDGKHLAHVFLHITDRLGITEKVRTWLQRSCTYLTQYKTDWLDNDGQCF